MRRTSSAFACAVLCAVLSISWADRASAQTGRENALWLLWTASGDDGNVGRASLYDLRYSTAPVAADTATWFSQAQAAYGLSLPSPAGQLDSVQVGGLTPGTTYYFVLRVADEALNWSGFSNVATGTTDPCNAPAQAPASFDAADDSGAVMVTWAPTSDPLATSLRIYRGVGTGTLTLLTTVTNLSRTSYHDTGVSVGTTYRYRTAWASSCGDGPSSAVLSVFVTPPPSSGTAANTGSPTVHAYPNPSRGSDAVRFVIWVPGSSPQPTRIRVYDLNGRWVADIANESFSPGQRQISWSRQGRNGSRLAPGYYEVLGTIGAAKVRERLLLLP